MFHGQHSHGTLVVGMLKWKDNTALSLRELSQKCNLGPLVSAQSLIVELSSTLRTLKFVLSKLCHIILRRRLNLEHRNLSCCTSASTINLN